MSYKVLAPGAKGADFISLGFDPILAKAQGFSFVMPYLKALCANPTKGKDFLKRCSDAQLGIIPISEYAGNDFLAGASKGHVQGLIAATQMDQMGFPHDYGSIFTADFDVTPANVQRGIDYMLAADASSPFGAGLYGDWDIIDALGHVTWMNAQANARGWSWDWARRVWRGIHPLTHLEQQSERPGPGAGIDPDIVRRQITVWMGPSATYVAPVAVPAPTLHLGVTSAEVGKLQTELKFWRFYGAGIDNVFGPVTETAVRALQTKLGFTTPRYVDGIYGQLTANRYREFKVTMNALAHH